MTTQLAIGKQVQSFWHSKPVADIAAKNVTADPASDEEWAEYITNTCQHPDSPDTNLCTNKVFSRTKLSSYWHSIDGGQGLRRRGRLRAHGIRDE